MAAFLAAIEAGDPGPFPTGAFVREEPGEGLASVTFSSGGVMTMKGAYQRRFTSNTDTLVTVLIGEYPLCHPMPNTYEWSFDGSELVIKAVKAQLCQGEGRRLEYMPWRRP
jgi:hypothetical protein